MTKDQPMEVKAMEREEPKLNLSFPSKGEVQPKGFEEVNVNDDVVVVVKGKVLSISENAEKWDPGKRFSLKISSCAIHGPEIKTTLDAAVKEAKKKV
jgi:predicted signal transduction protein with EAL and GGDEF domain